MIKFKNSFDEFKYFNRPLGGFPKQYPYRCEFGRKQYFNEIKSKIETAIQNNNPYALDDCFGMSTSLLKDDYILEKDFYKLFNMIVKASK